MSWYVEMEFQQATRVPAVTAQRTKMAALPPRWRHFRLNGDHTSPQPAIFMRLRSWLSDMREDMRGAKPRARLRERERERSNVEVIMSTLSSPAMPGNKVSGMVTITINT